jgi:hypothetical protein
MCQRLAELREAMRAYAAGFDAGLLSLADARFALAHATAIEHMAATVKALAATRVAQGASWREEGERSAAHELAKATGNSVKDAKDVLDRGRRLEQQPEVAAAARRGELSPAQAQAITDAAAIDPTAQRRLLDQAAESSLAELRDECARTKAAAQGDDLEDRRRAIHARRGLRGWTDPEGVWHLAAQGNPEDGAQVMAALEPLTDRLFKVARAEGRREPPQAYAFDALVELAQRTAGPDQRTGPPVKLLLRVDYDAWLRGVPADGETCELVGYGPISMSAVQDLLDTGDPFVAAILTKAKALVGVAHLGRQPTAHQQSALEWLYPSCAVKGCSAQARLQVDHRIDWASTHYTMLDLLDRLCSFHHGLKTREGWELIDGTGKRPFVPPDDPRHPRHNRPPPQPAAANPQTAA